MGYKAISKSSISWEKVGDKRLLEEFITVLATQVECSPSMILNTLTEIGRALHFALDIKGI